MEKTDRKSENRRCLRFPSLQDDRSGKPHLAIKIYHAPLFARACLENEDESSGYKQTCKQLRCSSKIWILVSYEYEKTIWIFKWTKTSLNLERKRTRGKTYARGSSIASKDILQKFMHLCVGSKRFRTLFHTTVKNLGREKSGTRVCPRDEHFQNFPRISTLGQDSRHTDGRPQVCSCCHQRSNTWPAALLAPSARSVAVTQAQQPEVKSMRATYARYISI
jgi:hypothetical protein